MKLKLFKNKKNTKSNKIFSYKILYSLVIVLMLAGFGYLGYFIYENYYQTITQAKEIQVLRNEVAPDFIDTNKVEKVIGQIDRKTNTQYIADENPARNPFSIYAENIAPVVNETSTTTP